MRSVSFDCAKGEILGLIGPNGAGKSSLVNVLSGVLTPDEGSVVLDGTAINGRGPQAAARAGLARTFQNIRLFPTLTVSQNTEVARTSARQFGQGRADTFDLEAQLASFALTRVRDVPAGTLSYGDRVGWRFCARWRWGQASCCSTNRRRA